MIRSPRFLLSLLPHLAAVLVIALCGRLALWQFDRAEEKRALLADWAQAPAVSLDAATEESPVRFERIQARGRFDGDRQILLDNQIRQGRTGVHVFTPFLPADGGPAWLVNRGWHALEDRRAALPAVPAPDGQVSLRGRLAPPPRVGLQLGEARALSGTDWPVLVTYLDLSRVASALHRPLAERVILLDPGHSAHLTGDDWQPVNFGPDRHLAYAWQWITMAVVVFLIWVTLTWRHLRRA